MNATLQSWVDALSDHPVRAANDSPAMQSLVVQIKNGSRVVQSFPVLASSKVAAQRQHECLCGDGEQAVAYTPEEIEAARRRENEVRRDYLRDEYASGLDDVDSMDDGEVA